MQTRGRWLSNFTEIWVREREKRAEYIRPPPSPPRAHPERHMNTTLPPPSLVSPLSLDLSSPPSLRSHSPNQPNVPQASRLLKRRDAKSRDYPIQSLPKASAAHPFLPSPASSQARPYRIMHQGRKSKKKRREADNNRESDTLTKMPGATNTEKEKKPWKDTSSI